MAADAERDDERDASRVFGTTGLPGEAGSLAISSRDAADRVDAANAEDLRDLLERANWNGDEVLARAVVQRAVEEGYLDVVKDFAAKRPELSDAIERLWNRSRRGDTAGMRSALRTLGMAPVRQR